MRDIGKNIKTIRQEQKMTQDALAEALYVTRQTVSNYENGHTRPDLETLERIAEILQTDVNTLIYGPPVPESKKTAYRYLALSAGIMVLAWAAYIAVILLFPAKGYAGYIYLIRLMNKEILLPLGMFLLGWVLLHGLSLFTGLRQLTGKQAKLGRSIVLAVGCAAAVLPIPFHIWSTVAMVRSYLYGSVSMSFPYIPVYQELLRALLYAAHELSFLYTILGGLCWLFALPNLNRQRIEN